MQKSTSVRCWPEPLGTNAAVGAGSTNENCGKPIPVVPG